MWQPLPANIRNIASNLKNSSENLKFSKRTMDLLPKSHVSTFFNPPTKKKKVVCLYMQKDLATIHVFNKE